MNYYEHHLGDYLRDTAHLSMLEDGAYRRLLDAYYIREAPLPLAPREVFRLVRAQSKQDREAVDTVLREFFTETPEGWTHGRCDREVARFQDKQRKAKASADARWANRQPHSEGNANASSDAMRSDMRTHSEGNAPRARPQTPDTSNQGDTPIPPAGAGGSGKDPARPKTTPVSLRTWLDAVKAKGEKPIPPDDAVFAYATEVGIPDEFLTLAWLEFRHRYSLPDAKRYRDWRAVFRKAVRANWLRLWFAQPDGAYVLTTVGIQAQRSHDDRRAA